MLEKRGSTRKAPRVEAAERAKIYVSSSHGQAGRIQEARQETASFHTAGKSMQYLHLQETASTVWSTSCAVELVIHHGL